MRMVLPRTPFIIAEVGLNANGDFDAAKKLISMACMCGCDAVKFQKRTVKTVYSEEFLDSPRISPFGATQRDQKKGLEFSVEDYKRIDEWCRFVDIPWFFSAWDVGSQIRMRQFGCPYNKIASAMLTHIPLLYAVAKEGKPTFISTGMSTYEEIDRAVEIFEKEDCPFILLHTVSNYPCKDEECNVSMVAKLKSQYGQAGYSGHETGLLPSILAVALGAEVVERHITLDRTMYGSDQAASLEKHGLEVLVRDLRLVAATIGNGEKTISEAEKKVAKSLRYFKEE